MKQVKKNLEVDILNLLKKGYNPVKISYHLNLSLPNISYYIRKLKQKGMIQKTGYGLWEVKTLSYQTNEQVKEIRGHAFIWKVRFNKQYNWKEILNNKQINYDEVGLQGTPRIILNNRKIWLGKSNIIIYFNKEDSIYAINSIESKKLAIFNLLQTINALESICGLNLGYFKFTSTREHYSSINNCLAIQCDKEGKSILVKNEEGYWFSIDNSLNLHEAEAIGKDSMIDSLGIQKYFNSHKQTNFKVTPEFILNTMNGIQQNQLIFDKNMKSHLEVLNKLGDAVNELKREIRKLHETKN